MCKRFPLRPVPPGKQLGLSEEVLDNIRNTDNDAYNFLDSLLDPKRLLERHRNGESIADIVCDYSTVSVKVMSTFLNDKFPQEMKEIRRLQNKINYEKAREAREMIKNRKSKEVK